MRISDWSSDVCSSDLAFFVGCYRWSTIRPGRKESGQRRLSGTAIKGVMRERQFRPFYQRLNVSRHGIRRHDQRSEEHTSELQSLMRNSYAVFCLKKKTINNTIILYTRIPK